MLEQGKDYGDTGDYYDPATDTVHTGQIVLPDDEPDSWAPVDLWPYLRGEVKRAEPSVGITRNDGLRLIYPGKEHAVIGEMECGKSWFCVESAAVELNAGHGVVYLHFEEADPADTVDRLRALYPATLTSAVIAERFRFVGPDRPVRPGDLDRLLDPAPTLVILDGVNEAMSLHSWGIRDEDGAALFRRRLVKVCTRAGAATLSADHVVKDREARGRTAIGTVHKVNALNGALFLLENVAPFGRGKRGCSRLYVQKDRPGYLRRHGTADRLPGKTYMGNLNVDDVPIGKDFLDLWLTAPSTEDQTAAAPDPDAETDRRVLDAVRALTDSGTETSMRKIQAKAGLGHGKVREALDRLVVRDELRESSGSRRALIYRLPADDD